MSQVFTVKMPESLFERLQDASVAQGKSKGAVVREAVEQWLARSPAQAERIEAITRALRQQKRPRLRPEEGVDWEALRHQAAKGAAGRPEDEVQRTRRRGL